MSVYQKVLVCFFRLLGLLLLAHVGNTLLVSAFMIKGMFSMTLWASLPTLACGLTSFLAAVPFAKIITLGLDE